MMKKNDMKIITQLRKDSRMKLTAMSRKIKVPVSTIYEKITNNKGLILKNTCLVDFGQLGYNARAFYVIRAKKELKSDLLEFLEKNENINTLLKINNGYDFMAECVFKSMNEVEDFKEQLHMKFKARDVHVYYVLGDIKKEAFLEANDHLNIC